MMCQETGELAAWHQLFSPSLEFFKDIPCLQMQNIPDNIALSYLGDQNTCKIERKKKTFVLVLENLHQKNQIDSLY